MRKTTTVILALCGLLGAAGAASAQSYGAPAGRDPSTAPGGTEGLAGPRNEAESIRSGDAVEVPPSRGGVAVEEPTISPPSAGEGPASR